MSPKATSLALRPAMVAKSTLVANVPEVMEPGEPVFLKTETELLLTCPTAISTFPSPSISPRANPKGWALVLKSTFGLKEHALITPPSTKVTTKGDEE